jgi:hypothetical protein
MLILTFDFIRILRVSPVISVEQAVLKAENKEESFGIRIAACTVFHNEVPNLPEWIEFYRLQGFVKFWIFNDLSADNVELLETLYDEKFPGTKFVEVFEHETPHDQTPAYSKCQVMALKEKIDWVAVMDVDEYWYPVYGTFLKYIEAEAKDPRIGVIVFTQIRFGTSGHEERFGYALSLDADGRAQLTNPHGIQLITRQNIMRGPYEFMNEPAKAIHNLYPNCSIPATDGWRMCENGNHDRKSIWRPEAPIGYISPHHPTKLKEGYWTLRPSVDLLRGNHYYYRSFADAKKKTEDHRKPDPFEGVERVGAYWNSIMDVGILRFTFDLKSAIELLITIDELEQSADSKKQILVINSQLIPS